MRRESELPRSRRPVFVPLSSACWLPAGVGGTHCMVKIITQTEVMVCVAYLLPLSDLNQTRHKAHSSYLSRPSFRSWSLSFRVSLSLCSISDCCRSSCMLSASSRSLTCERSPGGRWGGGRGVHTASDIQLGSANLGIS